MVIIYYKINDRFNPFIYKRIFRDYTCNSYLKKSIDWFWIAGFIQGHGSWVISDAKASYTLYISQHIRDIQILYKIKSLWVTVMYAFNPRKILYIMSYSISLVCILYYLI